MLQIISGKQGWITVDAKNQVRNRPIEKERLNDASKVNRLSPNWMQVKHEKPGPDPLTGNVIKHGIRRETNRIIPVERNQPKMSIFNQGSHRTKVHSPELRDLYQQDAIRAGKLTLEPVRLIEWNQPATSRDKDISPKIGSIHFH